MDPSLYEELTRKLMPTPKESKEMADSKYREACGSLLYLSTRTCPEIAVAGGVLSRHMSNPTLVHYKAVKRVKRYLDRINTVALHLKSQTFSLSAHADSD